MKEPLLRYFIVGIVFMVGFTCIGVYFQIHHWIKWAFFAVAYVIIIYPALEYWNEKLKG